MKFIWKSDLLMHPDREKITASRLQDIFTETEAEEFDNVYSEYNWYICEDIEP